MDSKFSILMPTYNDERHIGAAIESVLSQTYSNWELIIVDDGSTDGTADQIRPYLRDRRVVCLRQENADQLNALLAASLRMSGDYVLMLHSDDMMADSQVLRDFLEEFRAEPSAEGLYADFLTMDGDGNPGRTLAVPGGGYEPDSRGAHPSKGIERDRGYVRRHSKSLRAVRPLELPDRQYGVLPGLFDRRDGSPA